MKLATFARCLTQCAVIGLAAASLLSANSIYITGWVQPAGGSGTGGNNIYTNLNQQFPNTGAGTPGSEVGAANASFLYNPATYSSANFVAGSNSNAAAGINFDIKSNSTGQDFEQLYSGATLAINAAPFYVASPAAVYLLTAEYFGGTYSVTFKGSGGATQTFSVGVPDFCNGGALNSSAAGVTNVSVLQVQDVGACGTGNSSNGANTSYYLYEQGFTLNNSFAGQDLTQIDVTNVSGTTLVLGATATSVMSATPEPSSMQLFAAPLAGFGLLRLIRGRKTQ